MALQPGEARGSTDFGNVSYAVPGLHSFFTIETTPGTGVHQHPFAAAAGTDDAFTRATKIGSLLALTGLDLIVNDKFYNSVRKEWEDSIAARSGGSKF